MARGVIARDLLGGVSGTPTHNPFPVPADSASSPGGPTQCTTATPSALPPTRPPLTADSVRAREVATAPLAHHEIRALQGSHDCETILHAAGAYLCLQQIHGVDFTEPEFIADLHTQGVDEVCVTILQLHADSTRLQLSKETRHRVAAATAPSTQRQIDTLRGTPEGALICESQVD